MLRLTACCWFLLFAVSLAGCAPYRDLPAGSVRSIGDPVVERQTVTVDPLPLGQPFADYRIGQGDVLFVNINGQQEFASSAGGGKVQGSRVDGTGMLHLPMVGGVKVEGLTVQQAQAAIVAPLRKYLKDPWVLVEVVEFRSRPLYLLGQFKSPGTHYMDRSLSLLQGIALGNGFDAAANLRSARLSRNGRLVPVDIYELLTSGDQRANVWLEPGDLIYIPDRIGQQVFVFGAVKKPGPVPISQGGMTLAQAIASAELRETGYDFRHVRVIRSYSPTRGELLVVDFDRILRGEALPLMLREGDIVYVPKSDTGTWNDAIAEILPSLQAISTILQPFVQIKFLSEDD
jgi:polysaccharide export outer membrane protein